MAIDPRKLRPTQLMQLLDSAPLGEVISERQLLRHHSRAGLRIDGGLRDYSDGTTIRVLAGGHHLQPSRLDVMTRQATTTSQQGWQSCTNDLLGGR